MSLLKFLVLLISQANSLQNVNLNESGWSRKRKKKRIFGCLGCVNLCIKDVCTHTLPGIRPFLMSDGWIFPFLSQIAYL